MPMPENENMGKATNYICYQKWKYQKKSVDDFTNIRQNGKIAMKLNENDELVSVIHVLIKIMYY